MNKNSELFDLFEWMELVEETDSACFEVVKKLNQRIPDIASSTEYMETFMVLVGFIGRLNFLKNGVIDMSESDNLYTAKVVYRSFLEHWLKVTYIFTRFQNEKNNSAAMEYIQRGNAMDDFLYGKSLKRSLSLVDPDSSNILAMQELNKVIDRIKKEEDLNSNSFDYKKIIEYLFLNKAPGYDWLPSVIPEYSQLSTFVHGSSKHTLLLTDVNERIQEYKGMIKFVVNMSRTVLLSVVLSAYQEDKEKFKDILKDIKKIKPLE